MTQTSTPAPTVPTFCAGTGKRRVRHVAVRQTADGIVRAPCGAMAAATVLAPASTVTCRRCVAS